MFIDEITDERRDQLIDFLAFRAFRFQMETPFVVFLEASRPLSFIASQAAHFFAPAADLLFGHPYASEAGYLMQDRANIDRLVNRIEELVRLQEKGVDIWKMDPKTLRPIEPVSGDGTEETNEDTNEETNEDTNKEN